MTPSKDERAQWMGCIHQAEGMCAECELIYEEDPWGWIEYGNHPAGLAAWDALTKDFGATHPGKSSSPGPDADIPL